MKKKTIEQYKHDLYILELRDPVRMADHRRKQAVYAAESRETRRRAERGIFCGEAHRRQWEREKLAEQRDQKLRATIREFAGKLSEPGITEGRRRALTRALGQLARTAKRRRSIDGEHVPK